MSSERQVRKYYDRVLLGDRGDNFITQSYEKGALDLGISVGCPVAPDLVKPKKSGGRGVVEMQKRYGEVIFSNQVLIEELDHLKRGDLVLQLTEPRPRIKGEPLGEHSNNWIPEELKENVLVPTSGYILPRLLTEYMNIAGPDKFRNFKAAMQVFRRIAPNVGNDISLVVRFAEGLTKTLSGDKVKTELILKRLLSVGKLKEDNVLTDYSRIITEVKRTKTLSTFYDSLVSADRDRLGIYSPERLARFLKSENFGQGTFLGDDPAIDLLCPMERLWVSAWRHACPQPGAVSGNFGVEWARARYDECDFTQGFIVSLIHELNPTLESQIESSTSRPEGEPVGFFEVGRVPLSHQKSISRLSNLVWYAIPRVYIEAAGRGQDRNWERYSTAIKLTTKAINESKSPIELLARLTNLVVNEIDVDPNLLLCHILEPSILQEGNNQTEYRQVAKTLKKHAPRVWKHYLSLSPVDRQLHGIIGLEELNI